MRNTILLLLMLSLSGCVSVEAGLKLAELGVKVGFDIHNYVEDKKDEAKEIVDVNGTK